MASGEREAGPGEEEISAREDVGNAGIAAETGHDENVSRAARGLAGDRQTIVVAAGHGVPYPRARVPSQR